MLHLQTSPDSLFPAAVAEPATGGKEAAKQRKREEKLRRDAERRPTSMERWKILVDAIGEARHVIDLADHRARYALLIIGVLNAGVFAIMARGHFVRDVPAGVAPWLLGVLSVYSILTVLFVLHAIDCLRPRRLDRPLRQSGASQAWRPGESSAPLGLLFWEAVARKDLAEYRQAWEGARMEQLTAEAEAVLHTLSRVIAPKYRALYRLYAGLTALVVMAGLILAIWAVFLSRA